MKPHKVLLILTCMLLTAFLLVGCSCGADTPLTTQGTDGTSDTQPTARSCANVHTLCLPQTQASGKQKIYLYIELKRYSRYAYPLSNQMVILGEKYICKVSDESLYLLA